MLRIFSGIITFLSPVVCPAYIFWQAYMDFEPTSFIWWCKITFGLVSVVVFALDLQEFIKKAADTPTFSKNSQDVK